MIVWRDERFAIVDKPAGVAVHRGWAAQRAKRAVSTPVGRGTDDDEPLLQQVRDLVGVRVHLVNRLDRGASGAVLFALDPEAAAAASALFQTTGAIDKRYLAITRGHPPAHVLLEHAIPRPPRREAAGPRGGGGERVPATTELWCRETFGRYALVEARPLTGRLHQIRRHLKHLSCPLIGDVRYGKGPHNRLFRAEHGLHRLALHATRLAFTHPFTGAPVAVDVPLAPDLAGALASCRAAYTNTVIFQPG